MAFPDGIVPQWSPPTIGGNTTRPSCSRPTGRRRNGARRRSAGAPSPPGSGSRPARSRNGARRRSAGAPGALIDAAVFWGVGPQWSPPTIGGSTGRSGHRPRCAGHAAIEPADDRREHLGSGGSNTWSLAALQWSTAVRGLVDGPGRLAAMEPADDRREHGSTRPCGRTGLARRYGARRRLAGAPPNMNTLQRWIEQPLWSPPTISGSTPRVLHVARVAAGAAIEPADDRQEHGSTRPCGRTGRARRYGARRRSTGAPDPAAGPDQHHDVAAMEPADDR